MTPPYELDRALEGFFVQRGVDAPARLEVGPLGLGVRVGGTGEQHTLPWHGARLERRAVDGAVLVHTKRGIAGSTDPEFLRAIESAVGNELAAELARLAGERSRLQIGGWFGCLVFFLLLGGIIWSVPGCLRKGVDAAVDSAPFSVDEELGGAAEGAMDVGALVEDERVVSAVEAMVDRLARAVRDVGGKPEVTWHVRVVRSEAVNAFALPGGFVTVFTGLLEAADSPEMVAGVLAHEMAHVTERHGLRRLGQSLGFFAAIQLLLGDASGLGRVAKEMLTIASVNAYSREQENEADRVGVQYLHVARIDPAALAAFFELLKREHGDTPDAVSWLSTHPQHVERIAAIGAEAARLGVVTWAPIEVDWAALQEALDE